MSSSYRHGNDESSTVSSGFASNFLLKMTATPPTMSCADERTVIPQSPAILADEALSINHGSPANPI